jgi:hypothetical protein
MKLIGAGLPRTATTTQMFALEWERVFESTCSTVDWPSARYIPCGSAI